MKLAEIATSCSNQNVGVQYNNIDIDKTH